ncbi:MAG TPA: hypothetical protein VEL76_26675 [Gemmataceae bacterium]|nr:hypothetical protein [Gemmataceae bacterium]
MDLLVAFDRDQGQTKGRDRSIEFINRAEGLCVGGLLEGAKAIRHGGKGCCRDEPAEDEFVLVPFDRHFAESPLFGVEEAKDLTRVQLHDEHPVISWNAWPSDQRTNSYSSVAQQK